MRGPDGAHFDHAERGFAHRQNFRRARRNAESAFPMRERRVQCVHLRSARGHRVGDHIGPRRHRGGQIDGSVCVERIDAHHGDAAGIAPALQQSRQSLTRLVAARGRRKVFEVDDQRIGSTAQHGTVRDRVGTGTEEPGSSQVGIGEWHGVGMKHRAQARVCARAASATGLSVDSHQSVPTHQALASG